MSTGASDRIIDVDELMRDPEPSGEMLPERLDAEPLGGVMTGGDERDARFAREVYVLLRDLAGQIDVDAEFDRGLEETLRRAGAPRGPLNAMRCLTNDERRATPRAARTGAARRAASWALLPSTGCRSRGKW